MTKNPLVLIFDIGTQSTRALVFDQQGNLVAKTKWEAPLYLADIDCRAEKRCEDYWKEISAVSRQMMLELGERWNDLIAVSVTAIRNSLVFLDENNEQTRNAILWLDKREVNCPDKLPLMHRMLYALVGMSEVVRVSRKTTYVNWVRVNQPEVWERTKKVVMPSAYFNYRLTGKLIDSKASQAAKFPYNYRKRTWMSKRALNYPVFGCDLDKMCDLAEPGEILGQITEEAGKATGLPVGLPVIAAGADKACETLGCGCIDSKCASISLGTAASVEITTKRYVEPETFMPAYTSVIRQCYNPEIQIFRGYWMVSWFKKELALHEVQEAERLGVDVEKILDEKLLRVPPGSDGLILQPLWGPGLKNPAAKGAVVGFSDVHSRIHMYRAVIEGIGYALLDGLENLEMRAGVKVERCGVSGGGSQSDIVCQITADIFHRPIYRVQTSETSGLGAAILCFVGMRQFKDLDQAVEAMVHKTDEFLPNEENHKVYRNFYTHAYKKMARALKPINDELYMLLGQNRK